MLWEPLHVQRIVELQESWRIMVEFNTHGGPGQQYQEHKVRAGQSCIVFGPWDWQPISIWCRHDAGDLRNLEVEDSK